MPASTPASAPTTSTIDSEPTGSVKALSGDVSDAATPRSSPHPRNEPMTSPPIVPKTATITDSQRTIARVCARS
jgi:hypothetical protein